MGATAGARSSQPTLLAGYFMHRIRAVAHPRAPGRKLNRHGEGLKMGPALQVHQAPARLGHRADEVPDRSCAIATRVTTQSPGRELISRPRSGQGRGAVCLGVDCHRGPAYPLQPWHGRETMQTEIPVVDLASAFTGGAAA